jgi:hypothetical protein
MLKFYKYFCQFFKNRLEFFKNPHNKVIFPICCLINNIFKLVPLFAVFFSFSLPPFFHYVASGLLFPLAFSAGYKCFATFLCTDFNPVASDFSR